MPMTVANILVTPTTDSRALTDLQHVFDRHFRQYSPSDLPALADVLTTHCDLPVIKGLLAALLNAPAQLDDIARRSYWHGNGFLKIVLLDQGYKLRLHIWFAGTACEENIHSHRWGFASHVLVGTLKSELWQEVRTPSVSDPIMMDEYCYTAKQRDTPAQKTFVQTTALIKTLDVSQHAGNSYVMYPHELHKINHPGNNLVATMICTAPTDCLTNRLFPNSNEPILSPARLTRNQLQQAIEQFLARC